VRQIADEPWLDTPVINRTQTEPKTLRIASGTVA